MKHLFWGLMSIVLSLYILTGCATMRGPSELTPEVRKGINRVSISPELEASFPRLSTSGGIIYRNIQRERNRRLHERIIANYDPQEVMSNIFREVFAERISQNKVFELVDMENSHTADAEFVLEVTRFILRDQSGFPLRDYVPEVEISVLLFANPPLEIVRTGGKIEALDAHNHPILYHNKARLRITEFVQLTSYKLEEYESEAVFKDAFTEVIEILADKIAENW